MAEWTITTECRGEGADWSGTLRSQVVEAHSLNHALELVRAIPLAQWVTDNSGEDAVEIKAWEFAVMCPDGTVWDDEPNDSTHARGMAVDGDSMCGCEQPGHLAVERPIAPWRPLRGTDRASEATS